MNLGLKDLNDILIHIPDNVEFMFKITDELIRVADRLAIAFRTFKFTHTLHLFNFQLVSRSGHLILDVRVLPDRQNNGLKYNGVWMLFFSRALG